MLNVHKSAAVQLDRDFSQGVAETTIEKDNEADLREDTIAEFSKCGTWDTLLDQVIPPIWRGPRISTRYK
ncbi:unnamed protein product [Phytophthora fragariaefolia]|uniref:Unnamed protein product n=1 Tax=Phytophthora fragariaefolia TaxID=1490495 RepID=A0A9W6YE51_9STRA|nr:unnamed protein product [Phytophthora fragariaefolia]